MKKLFQFKRIQSRYSLWFVVIAMLPLIISTSIIYFQRVDVIKDNQFQKLIGIRDLKIRHLDSWIGERESDLQSFAKNIELRTYAGDIESNKLSDIVSFEREAARKVLTEYNDLYQAYHEIFIVDPITAEVSVSTKRLSEGDNKSQFSYFTEPLKSGELVFTDIYLSPALGNKPGMTYSIPLKCVTHAGEHCTLSK